MAWKALCLDSTEKKKKQPGKSNHAGDRIGLFKADIMKACIKEIKQVKAEAKAKGTKPAMSRNQISEKDHLSPSSMSKRMTGKVKGYGLQLRGTRRSKVLSAGEFQVTKSRQMGEPMHMPHINL